MRLLSVELGAIGPNRWRPRWLPTGRGRGVEVSSKDKVATNWGRSGERPPESKSPSIDEEKSVKLRLSHPFARREAGQAVSRVLREKAVLARPGQRDGSNA